MGDMSREPSMEEILSSIRRVIARDEAQISAGQLAPSPMTVDAAVADAATADDDVLDLTEAAVPLAAPVAPSTAAAATVPSSPAEPEAASMPIRAPVTAKEAATEGAAVADPLLSPAPQAAARQQLDTLAAALASAQHSEPRAADTSTTVHALVEASLRPMLRDWLDANLPDIVERIVAREIARISGNSA